MTGPTAELVVAGRAPQTPVLASNGRLLCYVLAPASRTGDRHRSPRCNVELLLDRQGDVVAEDGLPSANASLSRRHRTSIDLVR